MAETEKAYVVLRRSGKVMAFSQGLGGVGTHTAGPYLAILAKIGEEYARADTNWDRPQDLYLNGKLVQTDLAKLAWAYRQDQADARAAADRAVWNLHNTPDWLPQDEQGPGHNPPGVDKWSVVKEKP